MTTHLSFAVLSRLAPSKGTRRRREWAREAKSASVDKSVSKPEARRAQGRPIAHGAAAWAGLVLVSPALWLGSSTSSLGQATPAPQPADRADEGVSAHYKLIERYATTEDPAKPDQLVQYQVGTREITRVTQEKPQGAPEVSQTTFQTIYTERVGKLGKGTSVSDLVRRYDRADLKTTLDIPRYKTKLLEGLTVLYRPRPHLLPSVQCLVPGRQLREHEYIGIAYQVFLPNLSVILPRKPCRMGDTWMVSREAVAALVGKMPEEESYDVTAEISDVRKNPPGPSLTAVITVKGQFVIAEGPAAVNGQIHFTFVPSDPESADRGRSGGEAAKKESLGSRPSSGDRTAGVHDAKGSITKVSIAEELIMGSPGGEGRFKQTIRRELSLERRPSAPGQGGTSLELPSPLPEPDVQNTWLIYDDPQGRYHLLHPQDLKVQTYPDGGIDLLENPPYGQDAIRIKLVGSSGDPERDRLAFDPLVEKKQIEDEWKRKGEKIVPGPTGWLPESDWAAVKRKVYRMEAALIPSDTAPALPTDRLYIDHYLVQFPRNELLKVTAITTRDPHRQFRDDTEMLIKSFGFGPSESSLPASPQPARANPARR